jgi:hypothetical protein
MLGRGHGVLDLGIWMEDISSSFSEGGHHLWRKGNMES